LQVRLLQIAAAVIVINLVDRQFIELSWAYLGIFKNFRMFCEALGSFSFNSVILKKAMNDDEAIEMI